MKQKIIKLFELVGNQKVEKVLMFTFLFVFLFTVFWMKGLGASDVGIEIEKDGYCKSVYGEAWNYNEIEEVCFNKETKSFTEQEFREVCPKNKFISTKFNSNCWKNGDPR